MVNRTQKKNYIRMPGSLQGLDRLGRVHKITIYINRKKVQVSVRKGLLYNVYCACLALVIPCPGQPAWVASRLFLVLDL